MGRPTTRIASGALLVLCTMGMLAGPADAETLQAGDSAEAWYTVPPALDACTLPIGCPPASPPAVSAYPKGTLHVEFAGDQTLSHAYVVPDLSGVSQSGALTEATMTLPVTQATEAGNRNVETAKLVACPAAGEVKDGVYGGTSKVPGFDCDVTNSPATYNADAKAFTIDLMPLLSTWTPGSPAPGIALVPAPDQAPEAVWHVSFNGRDAAEKRKISSRITVGPATPPTLGDSFPGISPVTEPPDVAAPAPPEVPPAPEAAPAPAPAPEAAPPAAEPEQAPFSLLNSPWYTYRGVIFLPLAFLSALGLTGHSLTKRRPVRVRH